jgi:nickel-dependent lactate racemase
MNPHVLSVPCSGPAGESTRTLAFPAEWRVERIDADGGTPLDRAELARQLDEPISAPPLGVLAARASRVAIAVDDHTRPTPAADLVRLLLERLEGAGVTRDRISIIVAGGAHRPPNAMELEAKLKVSELPGINVLVHDPAGDLVGTGVTLAGVAVRISRAFHEADLRITVGGVMPHPFAGYSGGGKMVVPGLSALDVVVRTHTFALMGLAGGNGLDGNRFRMAMENAVRQIGLHWTVNVVVGAGRRIMAVTAGDMVHAHRAASLAAARLGATPQPARPLDAIVINAYPKDTEVLQMEAALVAVRRGALLDWLTPDAPIVLSAACPHGLGTHGLFERGGALYRLPSRKGFLGDRTLIAHAPGATEQEMRTVFWEGYPAFRDWDAVIAHLAARLPPEPTVGVLPLGPCHVPVPGGSEVDAHAAGRPHIDERRGGGRGGRSSIDSRQPGG